MIPFAAIIFDMDGLLVDSEPIWHRAEIEWIRSMGHEYTAEVRAKIIGLRLDAMTEIVREAYQLQADTPDMVRDLTGRFLHLLPEMVQPQPGAPELIDYIQQQGIPTAIASSSPISVIDATVEAMGWGDIFTIRCTADDVPLGKPAPDVYLATADVLKVAPADCLALEDSPAGSRAAVAAGMTCYAVPDFSHSGREAFADITPHVYTSLHDVLDSLTQS